jgi:branched-chain amino acid transport system ATP-binding protein
MPMPAARLEVSNLSSGYGRTQIVSDMSFDVSQGGKLTILGRNGVGKTTLLATLVGLSTRHGGTIRIGDQDVTGLSTSERARSGIGYVPQTRDVFPSLTVEENLSTGLKGARREALHEIYDMFPQLAARRHHFGLQLSGGEQQMLSLGRTLLGKPSVLLLDEPLEGLSPVICDSLMGTISDLAASGSMTIILVEQQIERAIDFADDVMIVERGRCVWRGTAGDARSDKTTVDSHLGIGIH